MCGAAQPVGAESSRWYGLSPRVWGSPASLGLSACLYRSIPTCVGQPSPCGLLVVAPGVYPHVCGAANRIALCLHCSQGLSPRVWGSRLPPMFGRLSAGSIPTCVGQPAGHLHQSPAVEVYPHVCGAAKPKTMPNSVSTGLSPRVWGSHRPCNAGG